MKKFFFALALMATVGLGGLVIDTAYAQNTNSSTTMERERGNNMGMRRRHGRHHRRHRRHMHRPTGNANM
jgi:hypothetical protein